MFIGEAGLFLIVLASLSFGACIGMLAILAMCKVSADDRTEGSEPKQ